MCCGDFQAFLLLLLGVCCLGYSSGNPTAGLVCHYYDNQKCEQKGLCNRTLQNCTTEPFCYTFWKNGSRGVLVMHQGCWDSAESKCKRQSCKFGESINPKDHFFCCCNVNFCNDDFDKAPEKQVDTNASALNKTTATAPTTVLKTTDTAPTAPKDKTIQTLLYSILPIFGFAVVLVFGFFMYHRHKSTFPTRIREEEPLHTLPPPSPDLGIRPIQLVEVISQGQFGTVWKADYLQDVVAVKVFPSSYRAAWVCEKEIYMSCNLKHENILSFIAAEKHTDGQYVELWLVAQYHENGSLADYLKSHVINWPELCCMAASMANGLAYLHTEIPGAFFKPCIAHRDFKSKNVLVKKDLSCCLSDFGLAMKFQTVGDPGETHGQVGTRRYMAPEVLEGAINFTRESFLYIDVYAFALVLWELASRCSAVDGPVDEYRLPFEEEIGSHPSLEDMQQAVVHKKIRPKLREDWFLHSGMATLLQTIEECWDQDAEARLTAQCVAERLSQFQTAPSSESEDLPAVTTVINNTNISTAARESTI